MDHHPYTPRCSASESIRQDFEQTAPYLAPTWLGLWGMVPAFACITTVSHAAMSTVCKHGNRCHEGTRSNDQDWGSESG